MPNTIGDLDISSLDFNPQRRPDKFTPFQSGTTILNENTSRRRANTAQSVDQPVARNLSSGPQDYRISLRSSKRIARIVDIGLSKPLIFKVTPDFVENRQVNHKTMDPVHMPGNIHVYGNTSSRTFQLSNIKLFSSTPTEATENMASLHKLRGWCMPFFGRSNTQSFSRTQSGNKVDFNDLNSFFNIDNFLNQPPGGGSAPEVLGLPPEVLLLTGYAPNSDFGISTGRVPTNIYRVPVVISNLTIPYPSDVDYIPTLDNQPFPRLITLDIQLTETHSPQEYERFSLSEFRNGVLDGF